MYLEHASKQKETEYLKHEQFKGMFEPEAYQQMMRLFLGRLNGTTLEELLGWWESRLLPAKQKAAQYPLTVALNKGPDVLEKAPKLYIGTAHSFKGAEADVVIVFPDLSPAGYREWVVPGEHKDSVIRLFYVALTRARESVLICEPASMCSVNMRGLVNGL